MYMTSMTPQAAVCDVRKEQQPRDTCAFLPRCGSDLSILLHARYYNKIWIYVHILFNNFSRLHLS
jgi:hypothetical protein